MSDKANDNKPAPKQKTPLNIRKLCIALGILFCVATCIFWVIFGVMKAGPTIILITAYITSVLAIASGLIVLAEAKKLTEEKAMKRNRIFGIAIVAMPFIAYLVYYILLFFIV